VGGAFGLVGQDLFELRLPQHPRVAAQAVSISTRLNASGGEDRHRVADVRQPGARGIVRLSKDGMEITHTTAVAEDLGAEVDVNVLVRHDAVHQVPQQPLRIVAFGDIEDVMEIAAKFGAALDQMHVKAGVGDRQGGRHSGDSAADHEARGDGGPLLAGHRARPQDAFDGSADHFRRLACGTGGIIGMNPGALLAQVDELDEGWVNAPFGGQSLEQRLVGPMAAGADHKPIDARETGDHAQAVLPFRQARHREDFGPAHPAGVLDVPGDGVQVHDAVDLPGATA
jgi:hypothetical protein